MASVQSSKQRSKTATIFVTGLALFAMFFGAGNLILPVMIGIDGGENGIAVTIGFLLTGVLLPAIAMVAAATSSTGLEGIAERIGHYPGIVFCWMATLTTGILYGVPRVATVSFSMSAASISGFSSETGSLGLFIYTLIFLVVTAVLVVNPSGVIDKIGVWLTPTLLILIVVLIMTAVMNLEPVLDTPTKAYASHPFVSGLLTGYNTLDAIASLVFGTVIISSLRSRGIKEGKPLFRATITAGAIAGCFLAIIYFGLANIGLRVGDAEVADGAAGLSYAASILFGAPGQWILGVIVILACLTTSVGLTGASVRFFNHQFPNMSRNALLAIHTIIALIVANLGLAVLMKIVVPMMYFCYPVTIAVVFVSIVDIFVPGRLYYSYRCSVWTAALFGLLDAIAQGFALFEAARPAWLDSIVAAIPMADISLGWVAPVSVLFTIGLIADGATGRFTQASHS